MAQIKLLIVLIIFSLLAIAITVGIARFSKRRVSKYIPSVFFALIAIGCIIKSKWYSQSFEDIAFLLMAIIAMILTLVVSATALIIDVNKRKKNNRQKN